MKKIVLATLAVLTIATAINADTATNVEKKSSENFLDRVHFKGDLRLRYESKETFYKDGTESTNKSTYHNRYRLR
jgi:hypothetical protein